MSKELDWIKQALHDRRTGVVAKATGLSEATITAIRNDRNKNPTIGTLNKLAVYLRGDGEE